eukprot:scaffold92543_cov35-Tisochrysis_lutea.AAC.3
MPSPTLLIPRPSAMPKYSSGLGPGQKGVRIGRKLSQVRGFLQHDFVAGPREHLLQETYIRRLRKGGGGSRSRKATAECEDANCGAVKRVASFGRGNFSVQFPLCPPPI